jgi:hypothetical protein
LYESVKEQLTINESKKRLSEAVTGTEEEIKAFYLRAKQIEAEGTDIDSAIQNALFDINNPDAAKELSSMNEAKKQNYGAGFSVVKEKKAPKKGMEKVEEINNIEEKDNKMEMKTRTLDELKAAKVRLENKIEEMEKAEKGKIKEDIGRVTTGAKIDAEKMMDMISGGTADQFTVGVALVLGVVAAAAIGGSGAVAKAKDTLIGWWKGLKDTDTKEKIAATAEEHGIDIPSEA